MALFGTLVYLPLFFQVVHGSPPTASGLWLLPLMGGVLAASIFGGRKISKIGRYRAFPIAGTALIAVGMFLLSRIGVDERVPVHRAREWWCSASGSVS